MSESKSSNVEQLTVTMPAWLLEAVVAHKNLTTESMSGLVRRALTMMAENDKQWGALVEAYRPQIEVQNKREVTL